MRLLQKLCLVGLFLSAAAFAAPDLQNLYANPEKQDRSEAIIFYNSANPCPTCPQAIGRIIAVLKANYRNTLHAYLINAEQHPEFIRAFGLNGPLTLVLVRISDGVAFGYAKLEGLQSKLNDPRAFDSLITEKINNFLNLPPEN